MKKFTYPPPFHLNTKSLSLSRRGAWGQVAVASILITLLPALVLIWAWICHVEGSTLPPVAIWVVGGGVVGVIILGYALLLKYPVSIVRLRHYLSILAEGGIPELVILSESEDDLAAVQHYMERIVKMAEDRIRMIQDHYAIELESERQRVMVESIGAMCHHLGQPASAMSMCLFCLRNNPAPEEIPVILAECEAAYNAMSEILDKLRAVAQYRSEPYLKPSSTGRTDVPGDAESRIIKV
jgi:hypothetical protein